MASDQQMRDIYNWEEFRHCPIGFGDCPDCIFWREGECQHKESDGDG